MIIGIPQVCMLALIFMNLGINLVMDGKERTEKYSFVYALITASLQLLILYKGGFFG